MSSQHIIVDEGEAWWEDHDQDETDGSGGVLAQSQRLVVCHDVLSGIEQIAACTGSGQGGLDITGICRRKR